MKVAIVQDWFTVNGGAEKVIMQLHRMYPDADFFSLVDVLNAENRQLILNGKKAHTSFIQHLPFAKKGFRNYLPLFPWAIAQLDLHEYDLIISSSYAVAKGVSIQPHQTHICYCHTPIRYAWDLKDEYLSQVQGWKRWAAHFTLQYIRKWDIKTANSPTAYIANSQLVADRIQRIYKKEAIVVHPPVDTTAFAFEPNKEDYYLVSSRLVSYKKIDLIVQAFNQMPHLKLVVCGDGPQREQLQAIANNNITFKGHIPKKDLITTTQKAKAFILAAVEDFGITSIEAQSCGTPVIALKKGGYLESVVEGKTGTFFNHQCVDSIVDKVMAFEREPLQINNVFLEQHLKSFKEEEFQLQMKRVIEKYSHHTK